MTDSDYRDGVLRRLGMLENGQDDIRRRLVALEVKGAADDAHHKNVERRLSGIESGIKWLIVIVAGSVITAGMTFILQGGLAQ